MNEMIQSNKSGKKRKRPFTKFTECPSEHSTMSSVYDKRASRRNSTCTALFKSTPLVPTNSSSCTSKSNVALLNPELEPDSDTQCLPPRLELKRIVTALDDSDCEDLSDTVF